MAHNELFRDQLLQELRTYQICRLKKTRKEREREREREKVQRE
jgi:hypothetical protein